ncbi:YcaO-like family protein [Pseudomonas sp. Eth.TT006]
MNSFPSAERELSLEQAHQRIHAELDNLNLQPGQRVLGRKLVAVQVSLLSADQQTPGHGAGKGELVEAQVGALYEALEHYLSAYIGTQDIQHLSPAYFCASHLFKDDSVLAPLIEQNNALTACRTYTNICDNSTFLYPVILSSPNYSEATFAQDSADYKALKRYASNSGTAIGASYNEALLHAINESIERDALSLFLLEHFYYQNTTALRRVDRLPAHDELGQLWLNAEAETGAEVVLLDISSEFLPRTFLAFALRPGEQPQVFGSGCSISPRHAARRALTELVQLQHIAATAQARHYRSNAQRLLAPFPRLLRCLRFDLCTLLALREQQRVTLPEACPEQPLARQIERLATDLQRHGRTLGVTLLHQTALGTTLVNVVIPGLERFFVVLSGNVVVPQARGRLLQQRPEVMA